MTHTTATQNRDASSQNAPTLPRWIPPVTGLVIAVGGIGALAWQLGAAAILAGAAGGLLLAGMAMWLLMPGMMINRHRSRFTGPDAFEKTVETLQNAIRENGWSVSGVRSMNEAMAKHDVEFDRRVTLVELCKADYAKSVLTTDRYVGTLMPCAIAVYDGDDGQVHLSGMNLGLMGKMFGGNISRVMGGAVARDEHRILEAVVKE